VTPVPLALPPDGSVREFELRLSHPDAVAHQFSLSVGDSSVAKLMTTSLTIPAGQQDLYGKIAGIAKGQTTLVITSPDLSDYAVPIIVTPDYKGVNSSYATRVGIDKSTTSTTAKTVTLPNLVSPLLGVVSGSAITGLSPQVVIAGSGNQTLQINGVGLAGATGVQVKPSDGLTVGSPKIAQDGSSLQVPITAAVNAPPTIRRVIVTSANGTYPAVPAGANRLRVGMPGPEVDSIDPIHVIPGATGIALRIRGKRFLRVHSVNITPPDGITIDATPQINSDDTVIDTRISVAANAAPGTRVVTVTTDGGTSSSTASPANTLQVVLSTKASYPNLVASQIGVRKKSQAPPTQRNANALSDVLGVVKAGYIGSLVPAHGTVGRTLTVTVHGAGLSNVDTVAVQPADGITVNGAPTVSSDGTQLTFGLTIAADAPLTQRNIELLASDTPIMPDPAEASRFQVTEPPPQVLSVTPSYFRTGTTGTLTVRGRNFQTADALKVLPGDGVSIGTLDVSPDGTTATARISVAQGAALGARVVQISTVGGNSSSTADTFNTLTLTDKPFTTYTPITTALGVVKTPPPSSTTTNIGPVSAPVLGIVLPTNPSPTSVTRVNAAPPVGVVKGPVATRLSPGALLPGQSGVLSIDGEGLGGVSGVAVYPSQGVIIGTPTVAPDGTSLTVPINIAADAAAGKRAISLDGTNGSIPFDTAAAGMFWVGHGTPEIYSIDPILAGRGDHVTLLVRGKNLNDAIRIFAEPADGIIIGNAVTVNADGTQASVPLVVAADALLGARVIRVEVPGATPPATATPADTFTVYQSVPH